MLAVAFPRRYKSERYCIPKRKSKNKNCEILDESAAECGKNTNDECLGRYAKKPLLSFLTLDSYFFNLLPY